MMEKGELANGNVKWFNYKWIFLKICEYIGNPLDPLKIIYYTIIVTIVILGFDNNLVGGGGLPYSGKWVRRVL